MAVAGVADDMAVAVAANTDIGIVAVVDSIVACMHSSVVVVPYTVTCL